MSYSTWPLCVGFGEFLVPAYTEFSMFRVTRRNDAHAPRRGEWRRGPFDWAVASGVAFPDRQPALRYVRGDLPVGFITL